jgi:hypothetical protein
MHDAKTGAKKSRCSLAHPGHWQGRKARYIGLRKNLLDSSRRSPELLFNENFFNSLNTIANPKTFVSTHLVMLTPNRDYWTDALGCLILLCVLPTGHDLSYANLAR